MSKHIAKPLEMRRRKAQRLARLLPEGYALVGPGHVVGNGDATLHPSVAPSLQRAARNMDRFISWKNNP